MTDALIQTNQEAEEADDRWIEIELDGERRRFSNANEAGRELSLPTGSLHSAIRGKRGFLRTRDGRRMILRYSFDGGPLHMEDRRATSYTKKRSISIAVDGVWHESPSDASRETGIDLSTLSRAMARGATSVKPRGGMAHTLEYSAAGTREEGRNPK